MIHEVMSELWISKKPFQAFKKEKKIITWICKETSHWIINTKDFWDSKFQNAIFIMILVSAHSNSRYLSAGVHLCVYVCLCSECNYISNCKVLSLFILSGTVEEIICRAEGEMHFIFKKKKKKTQRFPSLHSEYINLDFKNKLSTICFAWVTRILREEKKIKLDLTPIY